MKAWQFTRTGSPLALHEVPEPVAAPGRVVLDVRAAGLCHSDVGALTDPHLARMFVRTPITLGHEIAGVVAAVGDGVTGWRVGDRAAICPTARAAPPGGEGPAAAQVSPGFAHDGGFAERYLAHVEDLVPIPAGVGDELGAIATDAGMTAHHALERGGLSAGMRVGVVGFGGLGQIGARIAVLAGAEVHVAEPKRAVWGLASSAGAVSVVADAAEWRGRRFDLVVDYAGFGSTTLAALKAVRSDGVVVLVGIGKARFEFDAFALLAREARLLGSSGGTRADLVAVYDLMATGDLTPVHRAIGFGDIPGGLDDLAAGRVTGRLVAVL